MPLIRFNESFIHHYLPLHGSQDGCTHRIEELTFSAKRIISVRHCKNVYGRKEYIPWITGSLNIRSACTTLFLHKPVNTIQEDRRGNINRINILTDFEAPLNSFQIKTPHKAAYKSCSLTQSVGYRIACLP